MLTAGIAAEVLGGALKDDRLGAHRLMDYEKRWRDLLQEEIEVGLKLRRVFRLLGDDSLERLVSLASRDGILKLIHEKVDFDWHRGLIRAVLRHATVGRILGVA
jgi:flavin-dependent dehydrogenase